MDSSFDLHIDSKVITVIAADLGARDLSNSLAFTDHLGAGCYRAEIISIVAEPGSDQALITNKEVSSLGG